MKKNFITLTLAVSTIFLLALNANALPTQVIDLGDTTIEEVNTGYTGDYRRENLGYWFDENGITNTDGTAIDPVADQLQYELFYTDTTREYEVEFLGIGYAAYKSPFGVFSYTGDPLNYDSSDMTFDDPLFVQNRVEANTTYNFTVEAGSYFGFYVNSNGSGKMLTTMVAANPDASSGRVNNKEQYTSGLDHALFYETNKGYTISFEDIVGGGDADYEDLVVNFSPTDDSGFVGGGVPTPEPATIFLLGLGLIGIAAIGRRKLR
ncbi:hypothetical protein DENIS_4088 [Desulfonema ishimotonii]|uniref:PEP-CTERM protein-sorting domain-containing protein n=1 Tax=Desulfonema ishimotonii TaxID=45657 RepID=A0A401G1K6_9BACT|nr:DUF4114 domain-containing protein [Desulfonema ishimotonii]GBC63099.1 hypothetical protein DENIS_4088 [Desulfonema ishimotonii]